MIEKYELYSRTYDLEYGTLTDDIPFYVGLAKRSGGPVMELAVGTGRVAVPIAREGIEVHGIDITPEMLAVARGKLSAEPGLPLTLHEGDMRTVDLTAEGPFRLVYVPARAFLNLHAIEDQLWRGGFTLEGLYGDFEGTPLDEGGEEMVFVARPRERE